MKPQSKAGIKSLGSKSNHSVVYVDEGLRLRRISDARRTLDLRLICRACGMLKWLRSWQLRQRTSGQFTVNQPRGLRDGLIDGHSWVGALAIGPSGPMEQEMLQLGGRIV